MTTQARRTIPPAAAAKVYKFASADYPGAAGSLVFDENLSTVLGDSSFNSSFGFTLKGSNYATLAGAQLTGIKNKRQDHRRLHRFKQRESRLDRTLRLPLWGDVLGVAARPVRRSQTGWGAVPMASRARVAARSVRDSVQNRKHQSTFIPVPQRNLYEPRE